MPACLKDIKFKSVLARILSIEYISRILVEWELQETKQNLENLRFYVDRAEGSTEWVQLNAEPIMPDDLYQYVDYNVNLYDLQKRYDYRIRAVELRNGQPFQTFTSPIENCTDAKLDLVGQYVVDEHMYEYRYVQGVPIFIYKKRHDGMYCTECWDEVLKRVTKSNCKTCFGTGKMDGYYPPIEGWAELSVRQEVAAVGQQGVVQPDKVQLSFTNYPIIRIGDLIREIRPNYFWRVNSVVMPEKNRTEMLQQAQMSAVNRSDVEHKLKYPEDRARALIAEFEARMLEPEF